MDASSRAAAAVERLASAESRAQKLDAVRNLRQVTLLSAWWSAMEMAGHWWCGATTCDSRPPRAAGFTDGGRGIAGVGGTPLQRAGPRWTPGAPLTCRPSAARRL